MNLDFKLHDPQMEIFEHPAKYKVAAAGRRFGKSYLSVITLLIEGLKTVNEEGYDLTGKDVYYIAPTFQQAKDIVWGLLKELGKDVIASTVENFGHIRLINGRMIKIKGSDRPDTLRGVGLSYVVLDEYADMKPSVWEEIIFPTLTDVEGGALFIGTPKGKNHFYELFLQGQSEAEEWSDWMSWHFNTTDNPLLNKKLVSTAKKTLSSQLYRQEFEANFNATGGNIFKEDMIEYSDEPRSGDWYIAVDPAGFGDIKALTQGQVKRLDETAIAIVKVNEDGWWIKEIDYGRWGARETSLRILKHYKDVRATRVGIEKGILRDALLPYLEDQMKRLNIFPPLEGLSHGNQRKTDRIVWALQGRFQNRRIKLNKGEWNKKFIDQLLDFPNPLSHDDLIDALAYIDQIANTAYVSSIEIEEWEAMDEISGY